MSNLLIIPSIDIKDGKTIQVVKGIPELNCCDYSNDPIEMGMIWRAENAKCIHLVDFNSVQEGSSKNYEVIEEICDSLIIPVQLGGGIKDFNHVQQLFSLGVYRMVIGSMAHDNPGEFKKVLEKFGQKRIIAAVDVKDQYVLVNARKNNTGIKYLEYAKYLVEMGIERLVVTDVSTNGRMTGANLTLSKEIAEKCNVKVTHSGGICSIDELKTLKTFIPNGVDSVIVGRALYENKFYCQKMWRIAENGLFG